MTARDVLLRKIQDRSATVAVVGLGYVGLPLAVEFAKAGFTVIGYDVSRRVVDLLNQGKSHIQDVPASEVAALVKAKKLAPPPTTPGSARPTRSRSPCRRRSARRAIRT
jgi:UDP-N-acetyl-D-mannosaminuronate dehydrogenase